MNDFAQMLAFPVRTRERKAYLDFVEVDEGRVVRCAGDGEGEGGEERLGGEDELAPGFFQRLDHLFYTDK